MHFMSIILVLFSCYSTQCNIPSWQSSDWLFAETRMHSPYTPKSIFSSSKVSLDFDATYKEKPDLYRRGPYKSEEYLYYVHIPDTTVNDISITNKIYREFTEKPVQELKIR